ncbi:hypothetical protein ACSFA0_22545 [Variovorax sp. LT1P1]|uniref:hypothetical protein n=1 Tax=Variovorax sp. LT1P1 TaxID=3443730 RepID=UPI003F4583DC
MSKKNPRKEQARAQRLKRERLRAEDYKKRQRGAEAAVWDLLYGSPTARSLADIANRTARTLPPDAQHSEMMLATASIRTAAANYIAATELANDADARFPIPPGGLMFFNLYQEGVAYSTCEPCSLLDYVDGLDELGLDYSAVDTFFAENVDATCAAWLVGLYLECSPLVYLVLCGTRDGARCCFAADNKEWLRIHDLSRLTPVLAQSLGALLEGGDSDATASAVVKLVANGMTPEDRHEMRPTEVVNHARRGFAIDAMVFSELVAEGKREGRRLVAVADSLRAELLTSQRALRRVEQEARDAKGRLAQFERAASTAPAIYASVRRDPAQAIEPLSVRLRAIF